MKNTLYRLVVDTDHYAGNFERQSIAFATGLVGECGVGRGEAISAQEEISPEILKWWDQHGQQVADDHGVYRPARIHPTPGFFNHGMGEHFPQTDEGRAAGLVAYKKRVEEYQTSQIERLQYVTLGQGGWTQEAVDRNKREALAKIEEANALTQVHEHPSYQSVAIVTDIPPPSEVVADFSKRMYEYLSTRGVGVLDVVMETETTKVEVSRQKAMRP